MTNNNNQVNWDEIPEDVEAVITFSELQPTYLKFVNNSLYQQGHRNNKYMHSSLDWGALMEEFGDRFHLRPSPTTQPTPVTPESTQVGSSEVEVTITPEFDWSSVDDDVEAVIVSPLGHLMAVLKECDGVLLIGNGRGIHRMYPTRRANKVDDYPVWQLQSGDGILIRRPPAITPPSENVTCKVVFYEGELPEGMINLDEVLKTLTTPPEVDLYDLYKKVAAEVDKIDVSSIQTETYTPKPPSISTILQEAQQSILKHHGVTGKVKFTVTCSG